MRVAYYKERRADARAGTEAQRSFGMLDRDVGLARPVPAGAAEKPAAGVVRVERQCAVHQRHHGADVLALAYFGEDIGAMMALVDGALALNPNYARGWLLSGALRNWAGQPDIAIEHAEASLRLSPRARIGPSLFVVGYAHFFSRRFDEAMPKLLLAIQEDPSFPQPYQYLAACYAHMGRLDDAREIVERLRAITPRVIPDASYLRNPEHRELLLSGLRLAAGEAT